ncbi:MAG: UDP-N-acetylmuramoyl-tripeptide--D-alanyl-D-alanine ligase [Anaerovoracaceae bacterium]
MEHYDILYKTKSLKRGGTMIFGKAKQKQKTDTIINVPKVCVNNNWDRETLLMYFTTKGANLQEPCLKSIFEEADLVVVPTDDIDRDIKDINVSVGSEKKAISKEGEFRVVIFPYTKEEPRKDELDKLKEQDDTYIIGWCDGKIYPLMNIKNPDKFNLKENDEIIIRLALQKRDGKVIVIEESYIPLHRYEKAGNFLNPLVPIPMDCKEKYESSLIKARRRIGRAVGTMQETERNLSFAKMFKVLEMDMPEEFKEIADLPIKRLCSYYYEAFPNTVVFDRKYEEIIHGLTEEEYYQGQESKLIKAVEKGCNIVFTHQRLPEGTPQVVVDDPWVLYRKLIRYIRDLYPIDIVVGITGSIGKTSTSDMIAGVLEKKYSTKRSTANGNLQKHIGRNLQGWNTKFQAYVQEVGGGKPGGASDNSKMFYPNACVLTNIGVSHLKWNGTRENILKNKLGICDGMQPDSPLFLNIDNDMIQTVLPYKNSITFAIDDKTADYVAEDIVEENQEIKFTIVRKGERFPVVIGIPGRFNVYNGLAAFAVGEWAKVKTEDIIEAIGEYTTMGIRQKLMTIDDNFLYVDCYNAAPDSMRGAIETLGNMDNGGRRIAVLADMAGLGEFGAKAHQNLAQQILDNNIDMVICFGDEIRITAGLTQEAGIETYYYETSQEVCEKLKEVKKSGDSILFKASSSFALEKNVVDVVYGTELAKLRKK